jgi:RNA polymerase sigma-70 factor (ECF subfamily)
VLSELLFNEQYLLKQVSEGDEVAFRQLFDHYSKKIYSLSMYLTRSEFLAEEITQDVFLKIWMRKEQLAGIEYFNAWLKTIAHNVAVNHLKRLAQEKLILERIAKETQHSNNHTENTVISLEYERILKEAIAQLSPQQQKVYLLSRQEGLKYEEIAREMQISIHTVKEYMKKALHSIRVYLNGRIDLAVALAVALFLDK